MPTSDMRTHASITIPLSSTRSNTSIRLHVLGMRLTAISVFRRADNGFAVAVAASKRANHKCGKIFSACLDLLRRRNGRKHDAGKAVDRPHALCVERIVKPQAQYKARYDHCAPIRFDACRHFGWRSANSERGTIVND